MTTHTPCRCAKSKPPSQISLYLLEQSVCVYQLTVEGQFICPLLSELDDHGLFQVHENTRLFDPSPQADSISDDVDQSHSSSTSKQSQSQSGSTLGQPEVESEEASIDIKSEDSQTYSSSTSEQSQSHSGSASESHSDSKSEHSQSHSDSTLEQSQSHSGSKSGQKAAHT